MAASNDIIGAQENYAPLIDTETQNKAKRLSPNEAFLAKTIHPPSAVPDYKGIPTNDCRSQVVAEWVDNRLLTDTVIDIGNALVQVPASDIEGFAFLHTSAPNFPVMVFVKIKANSGIGATGWRQDLANTKLLTIYDMNNFWRDATLYRQCYKSYTYYCNTTAFNNVGECTTAQFNPSVQFTAAQPAALNKVAFFESLLSAGGVLLESDDWHPEVHTKFDAFMVSKDMLKTLTRDYDKELQKKGLSKEQSKALISEQQVAKAFRESTTRLCKEMHQKRIDRAFFEMYGEDADELLKPNSNIEITGNFKITPDMEFQIINFGAMGNSESGNSDGAVVPSMEQLTSLSKRSFTCPAREGQFVVNRLNKAVPSWFSTSHNKQEFSPFGLYECWYSFNDSLGNDNYRRFQYRQTGSAVPNTCKDAFWGDDWTWSWTVFDGMVPNVNISSSSTSSQLIQLKGYNGYEIQPSARSPWAGIQELAPLPDIMHIQEYERMSSTMKDGTISANNFLGALARGAMQVGKFLLPSLIGAATTNTTSPVAKKVNAKTVVSTPRARRPVVRVQAPRPPPPPQPRVEYQNAPRRRRRSRSRNRSRSASRNRGQQQQNQQPQRQRSNSAQRNQARQVNRELDNVQRQVKSMTFYNSNRRR